MSSVITFHGTEIWHHICCTKIRNTMIQHMCLPPQKWEMNISKYAFFDSLKCCSREIRQMVQSIIEYIWNYKWCLMNFNCSFYSYAISLIREGSQFKWCARHKKPRDFWNTIPIFMLHYGDSKWKSKTGSAKKCCILIKYKRWWVY